jgi:hypothetical protein
LSTAILRKSEPRYFVYVTARLSGKADKDKPAIVAFGIDVGLYD